MDWPLLTLAALTLAVAGLTAHSAINAALWLRRPDPDHPGPDVDGPAGPDRVAVLLPARNEAARVAGCVRSILDQRDVPELTVIVLDDGSTDGTADVVRATAGDDPRLVLVTGAPPPPGWLGKPYACAQLADRVPASVDMLVFVDADVVLTPYAVASAVRLSRAIGADLLSPFPRAVAVSGAERLVQPLLHWSWLSFLPLRAMERSSRPSLVAACGQFLVLDRAGYLRAGGHGAVRDRVLEDIELARAVKRSGGRVALADGSTLARCRMYTSWREVADGYGKSLWAAFGSGAGAVAVVTLLLALYLVPPLAGILGAATGRLDVAVAGGCGYLFAVAGRLVSARASGGRCWPDALAQPVSVALFALLVARSWWLRRRSALTWKDRPLP